MDAELDEISLILDSTKLPNLDRLILLQDAYTRLQSFLKINQETVRINGKAFIKSDYSLAKSIQGLSLGLQKECRNQIDQFKNLVNPDSSLKVFITFFSPELLILVFRISMLYWKSKERPWNVK